MIDISILVIRILSVSPCHGQPSARHSHLACRRMLSFVLSPSCASLLSFDCPRASGRNCPLEKMYPHPAALPCRARIRARTSILSFDFSVLVAVILSDTSVLIPALFHDSHTRLPVLSLISRNPFRRGYRHSAGFAGRQGRPPYPWPVKLSVIVVKGAAHLCRRQSSPSRQLVSTQRSLAGDNFFIPALCGLRPP